MVIVIAVVSAFLVLGGAALLGELMTFLFGTDKLSNDDNTKK